MANQTTASTWVFDSPSTLIPGMIKVRDYIWTEAAASGDRVIVQDRFGRTRIDLRADTPNANIKGEWIGWVEGFQVIQIDSGKLQVSIE